MEIVEIVDDRFISLYSRKHFLGCNNYFFILANFENSYSLGRFLIWPGGDIKLQRPISNKRLGRLKTKSVSLSKDPIHFVMGKFNKSANDWMHLKVESGHWSFSYDPSIDVMIIDEIFRILQRLEI